MQMKTDDDILLGKNKTKRASEMEAKTLPFLSFYSVRFWICILLMLGLFSSTSMRVDLSMAVVCMVNTTAYEVQNMTDLKNKNEKCQTVIDNSGFDDGYHGTFLWSSSEVSLLLSATWYGSLVSLWWSGYLADKFGPKIVMLVGVTDCVLVTLLTPLFANTHFYYLFAARFIMGIGDGMIFPSMTSMVARWIPKNERSTSAALTTSGNQLAGIFALLISSFFCGSDLLGGWPLIFYFFGSMGLVWTVLWLLLSSNNPESNRFISLNEKQYLERQLQTQNIIQTEATQKLYHETVPWMKILTSVPIIVNFIAQWTYNFSLALLQSYLPIYMKQILHIELSKNGLYAMTPFLAQLITKNMLGVLSDWLKRKGILGSTTACKLFQAICNFGSALTYLILALFVDCTTRNVAIFALIFHGIFFSSGVCGFFTSQLSLAPQYTGILFSVMRLASTLGSMVSVSLVGFINKHGTEAEWFRIWVIAAVCNILVGIIYIFFGSAEIQPWADKELSKIKEEKVIELKNMKA